MADIQRMNGTFEPPVTEGEISVLKGVAPVACMRNYQMEVLAYTKGSGRLFCLLKGYEVCHNTDEVIEDIGYDSESDLENPTGSVFCSHGAGFQVAWDQVEDYMHTESYEKRNYTKKPLEFDVVSTPRWIDEEEISAIFES